MFFDPKYFLFVGPAILLAIWAQMKVKGAYHSASKYQPRSGLSGREVAYKILSIFGMQDKVTIEPVKGFMGDHYDPRSKTLRLSPDVYNGRSLAALGIAAHEVGHAIQDASSYAPLTLRNAVVPLASFGSSASWFLIFGGFLLQSLGLITLGIVAFSLTVIFQLINLPVEYDASSRAMLVLTEEGYITQEEAPVVKNVLSAAALTYVAATVSSVLTLLYYLSFLGNRD